MYCVNFYKVASSITDQVVQVTCFLRQVAFASYCPLWFRYYNSLNLLVYLTHFIPPETRNLRFTDVFRGYKMEVLARSGLSQLISYILSDIRKIYIIWDKIFKNRQIKIFSTSFTWSILEYLDPYILMIVIYCYLESVKDNVLKFYMRLVTLNERLPPIMVHLKDL